MAQLTSHTDTHSAPLGTAQPSSASFWGLAGLFLPPTIWQWLKMAEPAPAASSWAKRKQGDWHSSPMPAPPSATKTAL